MVHTTKPQLWSDLTELSPLIPEGHSLCLLRLLLFALLLPAAILPFGLISGGGIDSQDEPDPAAADRARPRVAALGQAAPGLPPAQPHEDTHVPTLPVPTGHQGEPGRNAATALPQVETWEH